jgi:FkbM family methyltransferase
VNSLQSSLAQAGGHGWLPPTGALKRSDSKKVQQLGVEADTGHFEFMFQNFKDNGNDPAGHQLIKGLVGTKNSIANFPVIEDPSANWGAKADFKMRFGFILRARRTWIKVPCYSLKGILRQHERVDFLHCDIQGHEFEVLSSCLDMLKKKVNTLVIETHSRCIEGQLFDTLPSPG